MSSNLVQGAAYKDLNVLPAVIPCNTVPDIRHDAIIIGICGVSVDTKQDFEDESWFLSDFCAFNYLLKGLGSRQAWLSAMSEESIFALVKKHPGFEPGLLHGNPFNDRQIVFSQELIDKKELTPFTVHEPTALIDAFRKELKSAVDLSKTTSPPWPIMVFIFAHGKENLNVYLDYDREPEDPAAHINFGEIGSCIGSDVPATVVTTACYSGGWAIQPNVNMTILTAAGVHGQDTAFRALSKAWPDSESVSRACGSIFATTLIKSLTSSTTPLLGEPEAAEGNIDKPMSLQPANANDVQTETYNAFCQTIVNVLSEQVTRRPEDHVFRFTAQDDEWVQCWMARTGVPLAHFEARWNKLALVRCRQESTATNLDPSNTFNFTGAISALSADTAHGDMRTRSLPSRNLSSRVLHHSLKLLAKKHAESCPGDWNTGPYKIVRGAFRRLAGDTPHRPLMSKEKAINVLLFREQLANYIDFVVAYYKLPKSQGKTLLYWNYDVSTLSKWDITKKGAAISDELRAAGLCWEGSQGAEYSFFRAHLYLTECIYISEMNKPAVLDLIKSLKESFNGSAQRSRRRLMKSGKFRQHAHEWFRSIGKAARLGSPTKRDSKRASLQNIVNMRE